MFWQMMMPISTSVPMAMAMPPSDTMLASTPNVFMAMNPIMTARGITALTRMDTRKAATMTITTMVVMSTAPVYPILVMLKEETYPELDVITAALGRIECRVHVLDARELAMRAESPASLNVVVLGAYAALEEVVISTESMRRALGEALPRRFLEQNTRAFDLGYEEMRRQL